MLKDTTYNEKMAMLKDWLETIIQEIKKDVKTDHLKKDWGFTKNYFPKKNLNKLTVSELAAGYSMAIDEGEQGDSIGEFFANRWLLKNTDLYHFFEQQLNQVADDFDSLDVLDVEFSKKMMNESIRQFGAQKTYLFSVFNSVVFPKEIYDELRSKAEEELKDCQNAAVEAEEIKDRESMKKSYEQQIARLTDKYEKKLQGIERKYLKDTETLKKQVANLQKKLDNQS